MTDLVLKLKWIDELKQQPACSPFLGDFLDFIRKSMMIVDKAKRSGIQQVTEWLQSKSEACMTEKTYAIGVSQSQESAESDGNQKRRRSFDGADERPLKRHFETRV